MEFFKQEILSPFTVASQQSNQCFIIIIIFIFTFTMIAHKTRFSAKVFEVRSGHLAQMFAKECHFVSVEARFDTTALPQ